MIQFNSYSYLNEFKLYNLILEVNSLLCRQDNFIKLYFINKFVSNISYIIKKILCTIFSQKIH